MTSYSEGVVRRGATAVAFNGPFEMNPLSWWRRRRQVRVRDAFAQFLSPETIEALERNPAELRMESPYCGSVLFLVAHVRDEEIETIQPKLAKAIDIVLDHEGVVDALPATMIVAMWGFPEGVKWTVPIELATCEKAARGIVDGLGADARALYGRAHGVVGSIGSQRRSNYGAAFQNFDEIMRQLLATEFGVARQYSAPTASKA